LALVAAFMTFVLTRRTDDYFAWPIAPEITAAFIGACYLAAVTVLYLSSRATTWVDGRLVVAPVMSISLLLLAATLIDWDKFDQDHFVFWLWLAAYVLVPPVLLVLVLRQLREPGEDPPADRPLPGWARAGLAVAAAVMLAVGAILFFATGLAQDFWPWSLTPLTSRAIGAFIVGFGLAAAAGLREDDLDRLRAPALSSVVLGAAILVAVARYSGQFDFDLAGWIFLGFVATALLCGVRVATLERGVSAKPAGHVS
jgi:peptidoglycan/LPS O-acetylase OafA/YrhL